MIALNEYAEIEKVAIRRVEVAFLSEQRLVDQWQPLRFHSKPDLDEAVTEQGIFIQHLQSLGAEIIYLHDQPNLTLDSIYTRDALIISANGLILCRMGRASRRAEPTINANQLAKSGIAIAGQIEAPGTLEGGDFIWLSESSAAVGLGPRTNQSGIEQLHQLIGKDVDLQIVPLPEPDHPDDVFHLMSMISPLDHDLALIYRPLMPEAFINWLTRHGIQFVEVPESEFMPMGCNVLAIAPRKLLMLDNLPLTRARLAAAGCEVNIYKGDEISRKGEGGPTCLTRPLTRKSRG